MALLARPFMGTDLTFGGAVVAFTIAPAIWVLFALAFVAMPS